MILTKKKNFYILRVITANFYNNNDGIVGILDKISVCHIYAVSSKCVSSLYYKKMKPLFELKILN